MLDGTLDSLGYTLGLLDYTPGSLGCKLYLRPNQTQPSGLGNQCAKAEVGARYCQVEEKRLKVRVLHWANLPLLSE
jgi:hypothetical protein